MSVGSHRASFYQRRIALIGLLALVVVFVVGAPWYLGRIESDLESRVSAALAAAGFEGVTVSFSGQTGALRCAEPISRPSEALAVAASIRGVRSIDELPDDCRVLVSDGSGVDGAMTSPTPDGSVSTTSVDGAESIFGTVLDVLAGNPQFSLLHQLARDSDVAEVLVGDAPVTMFAPSDAAFDALAPDVVAQLRSDPELLGTVLRHHLVDGRWPVDDLPDGDPVDRLTSLDGGALVIARPAGTTGGPVGITVSGVPLAAVDVLAGNGIVHTIDQLLLPPDVVLEQAAVSTASADYDGEVIVLDGTVSSEVERGVIVDAASVVADRVDDRLTVDPRVGIDESDARDLAALVGAVGRHLLSGSVVFDGLGFAVSGVVAGGPQRSAFEADTAGLEVAATLTIAPPVSQDEASELEVELNELVAADPIRFATGSVRIDGDSQGVLDAIALILLRFDGIRITVEGHTDSDGVEQDNVVLSERRAEAVRDALVELGFDPDLIDAQGFGSQRPVVVDGEEDKVASRRVEFRVTVL